MHRFKALIVFVAAALGGITPAFATYNTCTDPLVGPTHLPNPYDPDITTTVVSRPASGTLSIGGAYPQTNFVAYDITLTQYRAHAESFNPVFFRATTTVVGAVGQTAAIQSSSLPAGCTLSAANAVVTCTFSDVAASTVSPAPPPPAKTFTLLVKSPTAGEQIKLSSQTFWKETHHTYCESEAALTTLTALSNPALNPEVVNTILPEPGTVATGTTGGAATTAQPWVTIVKVPAAAQVGLDLTTPVGEQCPTNDCENFAKVTIPGQQFSVGTRWYDPDAKSKLLVITLRKDVTEVVGDTPAKKALQILHEKVYYKPDNANSYQQVLLCFVTSGPTVGNPCIAQVKVYTRFNLPNVPNKNEYTGDHEWVIFANENGRYVTGN